MNAYHFICVTLWGVVMVVSERYVKYRKDELLEVKGLYESTLTIASHALFFRTGQIMGARISRRAEKSNYFEDIARILKEEGWVEDITFNNNIIEVKGSIEADSVPSELIPSCHMLRGILTRIYEIYTKEKVYCSEEECKSSGSEHCVFKIERR